MIDIFLFCVKHVVLFVVVVDTFNNEGSQIAKLLRLDTTFQLLRRRTRQTFNNNSTISIYSYIQINMEQDGVALHESLFCIILRNFVITISYIIIIIFL